MPDDTHIDLRERVAALEQMLVERTAERDEGLQQESGTRFTHPPPRWGRARVGVTDRLAVGVMPRTDPW
jgi:hypothetical protein